MTPNCSFSFINALTNTIFFINSEIVKKSYRNLCLTLHPDRVAATEKTNSTEKFKIISKIYDVLMNDQTKTVYDETGTVGVGVRIKPVTLTNAQMSLAVSKYAG